MEITSANIVASAAETSGRSENLRPRTRPWVRRSFSHWPILVPMVLVASVYHAWLLPGLITGEDFQHPGATVLATYFPWPSLWAEFQYTGYSLSYWSPAAPIWSLAGGLTQLGLSWNAIERVLWLFPFLVLSIVGPYLLGYRLTRSTLAAAVAASFFALNTWTIGLTERGHIPSLVAYSLMPFIFLALMNFYTRPSPFQAMALAGLLALQTAYDPRYAYITLFVVALHLLSRFPAFNWQRIARVAAMSGSVALFWLVFSLYWVLPLALDRLALPPNFIRLSSFVGISSFENLPHAIAMFYPFYHHAAATNGFHIDPVEPWFYAIPALVIGSLAAAWRRPLIPSLALIIAVGVIVLGGPNTVIGFVDRFLFVHLPGMFVFRDITKFSSLVAIAYALALAVGATRLVALARLRFPGRAKLVSALALVVAAAGYAFLMRDAYNPQRLSNFAPLPVLTQDQRLKAYLDAQPGYFRTAFYPTSGPYFVGTDHHPIVSIGDVINAEPFRGLATLSPKLSDPFSLWRSPLMPALVRQMNVRYFVIYDDPTGWVYRPFEYNVQRAEVQQFFQRQRWLHQVGRFGGNVVYRVVDASDASAFIARTPVLFDGTVKALDALAGTELWSDRAALILASQVVPRALLPYVHALVRGPDSFDPRRPGLCQWCDHSNRQATDYTAIALTALAMPDTMFGIDNEQQFKFRFESGPGPVTVQLHMGSDRRYLGAWTTPADPGPKLQTADELFAIGPSSERVLFDDGFIRGPGEAPGPGDWLALEDTSAVLGLINPTPWPESADVILPAIASSDHELRTVRFELGGSLGPKHVVGEFVAPPYLIAFVAGGGPWRTLHGLMLQPGITWLTITATPGAASGKQAGSVLLRADVQLVNERFNKTAVRRSVGRPVILASLHSLDASLAQHPRLWLHLRASPQTSSRLVLALETPQHRYVRVSRILDRQHASDGEDLSAEVQAALDTMFSLEPTRYSAPLAAYLGDAARGPREASSYKLLGAWIESLDPDPVAARRTMISEFTVGFGPGDLPPWSSRLSPSASDARSLVGKPLVAIDGIPYASTGVRYDPALHRIVAHLHLQLASDAHVIRGLMEGPFGLESALLSQGALRPSDGATLSGYREVTSAEYSGNLRTSGGLLVWPVSYDPAWALAVVPSDAPQPTGNVLLDWWRLRRHFLAASRHAPVNSLFNGWFVPPTNGRVVFLYIADPVSRGAALSWALLCTLVLALVLMRRRQWA